VYVAGVMFLGDVDSGIVDRKRLARQSRSFMKNYSCN